MPVDTMHNCRLDTSNAPSSLEWKNLWVISWLHMTFRNCWQMCDYSAGDELGPGCWHPSNKCITQVWVTSLGPTDFCSQQSLLSSSFLLQTLHQDDCQDSQDLQLFFRIYSLCPDHILVLNLKDSELRILQIKNLIVWSLISPLFFSIRY